MLQIFHCSLSSKGSSWCLMLNLDSFSCNTKKDTVLIKPKQQCLINHAKALILYKGRTSSYSARIKGTQPLYRSKDNSINKINITTKSQNQYTKPITLMIYTLPTHIFWPIPINKSMPSGTHAKINSRKCCKLRARYLFQDFKPLHSFANRELPKSTQQKEEC